MQQLNKIRELLLRKYRAYSRLAETEEGKEVIKDLQKFCYADKPTFDTDAMKMAYAEGRRSVFLRIKDATNITEQQLKELNKNE